MLRVVAELKLSSIDGLGLFAAEDIPEGTVVWRLDAGVDVEVSAETLAGLPSAARAQVEHYGYWDEGRQVMVLCSDDARFFNHASPANCADCPVGA